MNVHGQDLCLQLPRLLLFGLGGLFVLLDVEFPEQHDGFLSEDAAGDWIGLVDASTVEVSTCNACICEERRIRTQSECSEHLRCHQNARSSIRSRRLGCRTGAAWTRT